MAVGDGGRGRVGVSRVVVPPPPRGDSPDRVPRNNKDGKQSEAVPGMPQKEDDVVGAGSGGGGDLEVWGEPVGPGTDNWHGEVDILLRLSPVDPATFFCYFRKWKRGAAGVDFAGGQPLWPGLGPWAGTGGWVDEVDVGSVVGYVVGRAHRAARGRDQGSGVR